MIHVLTQHLLHRYMAALKLCQLWGVFLPPAKGSCIVDTTRNKPSREYYPCTSLQITSKLLLSRLLIILNKTSRRTGLWEILEFPKYFPKNIFLKTQIICARATTFPLSPATITLFPNTNGNLRSWEIIMRYFYSSS